MKRLTLSLFALALGLTLRRQIYSLTSPDLGKLKVDVEVGKTITYAVSMNGQLLAPSAISATLNDGSVLGAGARVKSAATTQHRGSVPATI